MKTLTIIIPVYNEEGTITQVLKAVDAVDVPGWKKEVLVIDDGSSDETSTKAAQFITSHPNVRLLSHKKNQGKGKAVQNGFTEAKGDYIIIQDADLEYSPTDIPKLLQPISSGKAEVVYGTRLKRLPNFKRDERTFRFLMHYLGNRALSLLISILHGQMLTDMETGYKVFPRKAVKNEAFRSRGFEFEPEITIKLIRAGYTIHEVPIRTNPRGYDKGKKLRTIPDGIKALKMILGKR